MTIAQGLEAYFAHKIWVRPIGGPTPIQPPGAVHRAPDAHLYGQQSLQLLALLVEANPPAE